MSYTHGSGTSCRRNMPVNRKKAAREEIRLAQFMVCVVLFLVVFVGKGVFPDRINQVEEEFLCLIGMDTDFQAAFSSLGKSMAQRSMFFEELSSFCVEVFGVETEESVPAVALVGSSFEQEQYFLNSQPDHAEFTAHLFRMEELPREWCAVQQVSKEEVTVPAAGTVLVEVNYQGPELPEGYTMDYISLGTLETCAPVMGTMWSKYGYRTHPIDGAYKFHNGVDLGAEHGTDIGAFTAGTVEYIGENDVYGLYLQIDHGNGIKSFYAHCSRLCVGQGQWVETGEKVAEVGDTGSATGPHLHFELKYADTHLDPAHYITYYLPS